MVNIDNEDHLMSERKTSENWQSDFPNLIILDPAGWDTRNFNYAFHEEVISYETFMKRVKDSVHFVYDPVAEPA